MRCLWILALVLVLTGCVKKDKEGSYLFRDYQESFSLCMENIRHLKQNGGFSSTTLQEEGVISLVESCKDFAKQSVQLKINYNTVMNDALILEKESTK